jgi:lysophospholipase L1-like esterase
MIAEEEVAIPHSAFRIRYYSVGQSGGIFKDMKTIILIGDSIRMGYQEVVQRELGESANVWWPKENGGTSQNILDHLDEWIITRNPDLVHLNCGLHDLRKEFGAQEGAIPLPRYQSNVERILRQISDRTDATLIWATTTPVNEEWHHRKKGFDRLETDVLAYNRVSREVCHQFGIPINDLFEVITRSGRDRLLLKDGVHFTDEGYAILGKAVAEVIRAYL